MYSYDYSYIHKIYLPYKKTNNNINEQNKLNSSGKKNAFSVQWPQTIKILNSVRIYLQQNRRTSTLAAKAS